MAGELAGELASELSGITSICPRHMWSTICPSVRSSIHPAPLHMLLILNRQPTQHNTTQPSGHCVAAAADWTDLRNLGLESPGDCGVFREKNLCYNLYILMRDKLLVYTGGRSAVKIGASCSPPVQAWFTSAMEAPQMAAEPGPLPSSVPVNQRGRSRHTRRGWLVPCSDRRRAGREVTQRNTRVSAQYVYVIVFECSNENKN